MIHTEGWWWRPALMTKALSPDLRIRIIQAVEGQGMSRRAAAERFRVAPSTVVELLRQWKATGTYEARAQGGTDVRRRSKRTRLSSSRWLRPRPTSRSP